jgi:hypothetical protein
MNRDQRGDAVTNVAAAGTILHRTWCNLVASDPLDAKLLAAVQQLFLGTAALTAVIAERRTPEEQAEADAEAKRKNEEEPF